MPDESLLLLLSNAIIHGSLIDFNEYLECAKNNDIVLNAEFFNCVYDWPEITEKFSSSSSLLSLAAFYGQIEIVDYLFEFYNKNIDVNFSDSNENTALHLCVLGCQLHNDIPNKHDLVIDYLLLNAADHKLKNMAGKTANQLLISSPPKKPQTEKLQGWIDGFFIQPLPEKNELYHKQARIKLSFAREHQKSLAIKRKLTKQHDKISMTFEEFCILRASKNNYIDNKSLGYGFVNTTELLKAQIHLPYDHKQQLVELQKTCKKHPRIAQKTIDQQVILPLSSLLIAVIASGTVLNKVGVTGIITGSLGLATLAYLYHSYNPPVSTVSSLADIIENHTPFKTT